VTPHKPGCPLVNAYPLHAMADGAREALGLLDSPRGVIANAGGGDWRTMTVCTKCSGCGFYLDYAGPGIAGGIKVPCKPCGGTGWIKQPPR